MGKDVGGAPVIALEQLAVVENGIARGFVRLLPARGQATAHGGPKEITHATGFAGPQINDSAASGMPGPASRKCDVDVVFV